jgi:CDP-glucose 4,6-dehydratase
MSGISENFWSGRRVLLTGHTGFKGAWLSLWLCSLGAKVCGYALSPATTPSLFQWAEIDRIVDSHLADIRDLERLKEVMEAARPEVVFHLAAQALVRHSYDVPVETFATNVMGTVNLLEAVRQVGGVRAVVIVTSDKCYENNEWLWGYREPERMGGHDPYSASKGCAEIVTAAYRRSFFGAAGAEGSTAVASARAGNVIGGGDWAADRLVPDIMRAFTAGQPAAIRNPAAVRPWQHVLEPLSGYLLLAKRLATEGPRYAEGWNFGPTAEGEVSVGDVARMLANQWGSGTVTLAEAPHGPHEAHFLKLDSSKARARLGWKPRLPLVDALKLTVEWYRKTSADPTVARVLTLDQIQRYSAL